MIYGGLDVLFSLLFPLVFLLALGTILFALVGNLRTWNKTTILPG